MKTSEYTVPNLSNLKAIQPDYSKSWSAPEDQEPNPEWDSENSLIHDEVRKRLDGTIITNRDEICSWLNALVVLEKMKINCPESLKLWTETVAQCCKNVIQVHKDGVTLIELISPAIKRLKAITAAYETFDFRKALEHSVAVKVKAHLKEPLARLEERGEQFSKWMIEFQGQQIFKTIQRKCDLHLADQKDKFDKVLQNFTSKWDNLVDDHNRETVAFAKAAQKVMDKAKEVDKRDAIIEKLNSEVKVLNSEVKVLKDDHTMAIAAINDLRMVVAQLNPAVQTLQVDSTAHGRDIHYAKEDQRLNLECEYDASWFWDACENDGQNWFKWRKPPPTVAPITIRELKSIDDLRTSVTIAGQPKAQSDQASQATQPQQPNPGNGSGGMRGNGHAGRFRGGRGRGPGRGRGRGRGDGRGTG
jgi:hypothetical protein